MRSPRTGTPKFKNGNRDRTRSHGAKSTSVNRRKARAAKRDISER